MKVIFSIFFLFVDAKFIVKFLWILPYHQYFFFVSIRGPFKSRLGEKKTQVTKLSNKKKKKKNQTVKNE